MSESPKPDNFINERILNLKPGEKLSVKTEDLPDWLVKKISEGEMDPELNYLNDKAEYITKKDHNVSKLKKSPSL